MANPQTTYVKNEQPYLYCSACGRKDYRLLEPINSYAVAFSGATQVNANLVCNAFNSAPAKYPQAPCLGTMTASTQTLSQLNNQNALLERSSS